MPRKKKTVHTKREKHGVPLLVYIRRRFWFFAVVAGIALFGSTQLTLTQDYRTAKSVLGDENNQETSNEQHDQPTPKQNTNTNLQRNEIEIQNQNGEHLQAQNGANGITKAAVSAPGFQFQYEVGDDGKVELQAQDNEGNVLKNRETERRQLEQEIEDEGLEVSSEDGELEINEASVSAITHFPLSVNPTTRALTVTTPKGVKTVTILPNQAIQNFLANGIVPLSTSSGFLAGTTASSSAKPLSLTVENNDLVYETQGEEQHNLFGFIPVTTTVTARISAENGGLVSKTESVLDRIISALSF